MKLALFGKRTHNTRTEAIGEFLDHLLAEEIAYRIQDSFALELKPVMQEWDRRIEPYLFRTFSAAEKYDFAFSFGGDGTFLNTVKRVAAHEIPVLGVHSGRMGFLTSVTQDNLISAVSELRRDMYRIEKRTALVVESDPPGLFGADNCGLNDLTIHKSSTNEMITVHTYINGEFLNSYWGDGLIIATPTGSTAYSLSCGGPIILPTAGSFVITPVAPHSLTIRPLIIPDHSVVSFEVESRAGQVMVALDTHTELVAQKTQIAVRRADFTVRLVRLSSGNYFDTLRDRLMWGKDTRN